MSDINNAHWSQTCLGDSGSRSVLDYPVSVLFTEETAMKRDVAAWTAMSLNTGGKPTKMNAIGNRRFFTTASGATMHFLHLEQISDVHQCPAMHRIHVEFETISKDAMALIGAMMELLEESQYELRLPRSMAGMVKLLGPLIVEPALWLSCDGAANSVLMRHQDQWRFDQIGERS